MIQIAVNINFNNLINKNNANINCKLKIDMIKYLWYVN